MRTLGLAVLAAIAGLGQPSAVPTGPLVVVIDGDSAVADAEAAARLRAALLEHLDPDATATYFALTADRLAPVPPAEAASFQRTVFTVTPPRYSGVSVTFTESVEVLRGDEALRDELIARRCPPAAQECGGRLHAAVDAEARRTETASARKLRALVAAAAAWRGARVVLLTAGWPTRDDARAGVGGALRELRGRGVSLFVVRVPPREPYRGLVRDASESLAAQLPAGFVALAVEPDVVRAAALVSPGVPQDDQPPSSEASRPLNAAATPPEALAGSGDRVQSRASTEGVAASPVVDATLRKAAAYVAKFEQTFTGVVWHERYQQEDRVWRRFGSSGATTSTVVGRRTLESELFFAWLPQDRTWISVRDVVTVDSQPRPPGERRLPLLAARGTVSVLELRDLARENGRFNIGQIVRTFNEPTLALLFLDERHRAQVRFSRKGGRRVDLRRLATYAFAETGRPTLIHSEDRDVPVSGSFDIDESTGEIWTSTVEMSERAGRLTGSMAVEYRPHVAFDVLVPHEMRETYASAHTEQVTATATYSDFRRFQTAGRLITP